MVDLHAITVPQDPKQLKVGVFNAAATYLAAGVDPQKSKVFVQVRVISNAIQGFEHHPSPFFKMCLHRCFCPMMVFLVGFLSYRLSVSCERPSLTYCNARLVCWTTQLCSLMPVSRQCARRADVAVDLLHAPELAGADDTVQGKESQAGKPGSANHRFCVSLLV